jgi:DNA-directed RNA polymerase subunit RPC12/RpoP
MRKKHGWFDDLLERETKGDLPEQIKVGEVVLRPALRQIGTTDCPVCKHEVAVFLTKNSRPFINCSFCSARIFYNGRESMRRLKRNIAEVDG